jgi:cytochrome c oxidase assembly protein subunit 15
LGQFLGIFGQGVLGGITVLTDLHPLPVAGHLILSIILIAGATSLRAQRFAPKVAETPAPLTKTIAIGTCDHLICSHCFRNLVTGSGPHAGG